MKAETIVGHVPREIAHVLELHYAWWERDNGKEDARQMRDNEKEDARKRGGGADKRGGGAITIPILSMWKNRGGGADKRWGAL